MHDENECQQQVDALKEQFLLQVDRELCTPLTIVYCYLDLLKTGHGRLTPTEQGMFLEKALKACKDLVQVTNQVLQSLEKEAYAPDRGHA